MDSFFVRRTSAVRPFSSVLTVRIRASSPRVRAMNVNAHARSGLSGGGVENVGGEGHGSVL